MSSRSIYPRTIFIITIVVIIIIMIIINLITIIIVLFLINSINSIICIIITHDEGTIFREADLETIQRNKNKK